MNTNQIAHDVLTQSVENHCRRFEALAQRLHATNGVQRRGASVEADEVVRSAGVLARIVERYNQRALADGTPIVE